MTKKDYVKFAKLLRENQATSANAHDDAVVLWQQLVSGVADILEEDNSRFDRARFLKAAYGL